MGILQLMEARQRDLGGFVVRRVQPAAGRQMVGPFIFFDHMGPTQFEPAHGIDVRRIRKSWVALPDGHEDGEPNFTHSPSSVIPQRVLDGALCAGCGSRDARGA